MRLPITRIIRCVFDLEGGPADCKVVGGRHAKANGIAAFDGDVFVVDSLSFSITRYARTNDGDLVERDRIKTPHAADNLNILEDGTMHLGTMPKLHQCVDPTRQPVVGALTVIAPANASAPVPRDVSRGVRTGDDRYVFRDAINSAGDIVNQISCGVLVGSCDGGVAAAAPPRRRRALLGSPWHSGALICDLACICFSESSCYTMSVT